ncbi:DUF190 domain-containing protein [Nonomuraea sp. NBC_01738]|uniref:DUF190 domain-containing protein n=1 Tax=Nonomuraea sp. NBC_01738 TaxID=2976003 RepID=UPI002E0E646F|nr:DUF190 domain-containing protein [Nonomuraea sp. NBC_01738]
MTLSGPASRLTIYLGEDDRYHHRPLHTEIVRRARASGLAGASVFRGMEGFGASSLIHTSGILSLSDDLPIAVVVIDTEDRIDAFVAELDELAIEGLVIIDQVTVHRYQGRERPR